MSAEYRRKIVNWLTSMLVLHLVALLCGLLDWFIRSRFLLADYPDRLWTQFGSFIYVAEGYAIWFVFLWFWHTADFLQDVAASHRVFRIFDSHQNLLAVLVMIGAWIAFIQSGWLDDLFCDWNTPSTDRPIFDGCGSMTPIWKQTVGFVLFLTMALTVLGKVILSLASRATALRKWAHSETRQESKPSHDRTVSRHLSLYTGTAVENLTRE